jgi:2-oxoisovalerate dehydrogenase E1 component alpha subunit
MSTVANFTISYSRFLSPTGEVLQPLPEFAKQAVNLISYYKFMVLTRCFDAKAINLQRTGKIGTYPSSLGQEAISTAMGACLQSDDIFCPYYREVATQLQRGVTMAEILAYWGGDERGNNFAANPYDLSFSVPLATQCLHAAGLASAIKIKGQARVVVVVCGDGATSRGDFYEALNIAGVWQLPVVFVINNNQWAISVPRSAQTHASTLAQKAIAAGFVGEQVDGNDLIAVKHSLDLAMAKARSGGGPSLIEAVTYRLCDHTTADDAKRYWEQETVDKAWQEEPINRLGLYLRQQGVWDDAKEAELHSECQTSVDKAVNEYLHLPPAPLTDMFDYLYAALPAIYLEQRQEVANG